MSILKNNAFLTFWLAICISYFVDTLMQMGLIQLIMQNQAESGSQIALVFFFNSLPAFLFGFLSGFLNDKFPTTSLLMLGNLFKLIPLGILLGGMAFLPVSIPSQVFIFSFLFGIGSAFFYTSTQAFIPAVLPAQNLQKGNALISASGVILILLGGILSPYILKQFGSIQSPTLIASISGLWLFISALFIPLRRYNLQDTFSQLNKNTLAKSSSHLWQDFLNIRTYLNRHKSVQNALSLSIVLSLITALFFHAFNAVGIDVYHIELTGFSKLKAMLGAGMFLGSLLCMALSHRVKASYLIAGAFFILMLTTVSASLANTYFLALFWLIPIGMANAGLVITSDTLLQRLTPVGMRGKVFGLKTMLTSFIFLVGTWSVSQILAVASPFLVLKMVAGLAFIMLTVVLFFDPAFSFFILRSVVVGCFKRFYTLNVIGAKHIPETGKVLLCGNHTGWLDTLIITSAVRRPIWFIAGPAAFEIPVLRRIVPHLNVIPLTFGRGMKALENAVIALKKGRCVLIFPEGKLTTEGEINTFQRGIGYLHSQSQAPLVPFYIKGGFDAWGLNRFPKLGVTITIEFLHARSFPEENDKQIAKFLEEEVKSAYEKALL
jgi:1-acyl-sn-glycerol-3-phosphate acyltransferase